MPRSVNESASRPRRRTILNRGRRAAPAPPGFRGIPLAQLDGHFACVGGAVPPSAEDRRRLHRRRARGLGDGGRARRGPAVQRADVAGRAGDAALQAAVPGPSTAPRRSSGCRCCAASSGRSWKCQALQPQEVQHESSRSWLRLFAPLRGVLLARSGARTSRRRRRPAPPRRPGAPGRARATAARTAGGSAPAKRRKPATSRRSTSTSIRTPCARTRTRCCRRWPAR